MVKANGCYDAMFPHFRLWCASIKIPLLLIMFPHFWGDANPYENPSHCPHSSTGSTSSILGTSNGCSAVLSPVFRHFDTEVTPKSAHPVGSRSRGQRQSGARRIAAWFELEINIAMTVLDGRVPRPREIHDLLMFALLQRENGGKFFLGSPIFPLGRPCGTRSTQSAPRSSVDEETMCPGNGQWTYSSWLF